MAWWTLGMLGTWQTYYINVWICCLQIADTARQIFFLRSSSARARFIDDVDGVKEQATKNEQQVEFFFLMLLKASTELLLLVWTFEPSWWKNPYSFLSPKSKKVAVCCVHRVLLNSLYSKRRWIILTLSHREHTILQMWCHITVLRLQVWDYLLPVICCFQHLRRRLSNDIRLISLDFINFATSHRLANQLTFVTYATVNFVDIYSERNWNSGIPTGKFPTVFIRFRMYQVWPIWRVSGSAFGTHLRQEPCINIIVVSFFSGFVFLSTQPHYVSFR